MNKIQKGFTLIELMIVIAIIGVLAAIAIPSYQDYIARAQVTEAVTLLSSYKTGLSEYVNLNGNYNDISDMDGVGDSQSGKYVDNIDFVYASGGTIIIKAVMRSSGVSTGLEDGEIAMGTYNGAREWVCGTAGTTGANTVEDTTDIDPKFLPGSCRQ